MNKHRSAFALLTLLFFMWGFITVTNDILVNSFKRIFELSHFQRSLVQQAFFGAFFVISLIYYLYSSLTGRDPVNRIGYNRGMVIGLLVCGLGCIMFYPAAMAESYIAFLLALFVLATGVSILQICANPYAAILGNPDTAGSRLNLAQGLNSLGTTLGPLVGFLLIYVVFSDGNPTALSVSQTYLLYGSVFFLLSILTWFSGMPSFRNDATDMKGFGVLNKPALVLGVLAIFFYVGAEVSVGTWIVEFLKSTDGGKMDEGSASYMLSYFWGGLMIGRLVGASAFSSNGMALRLGYSALYALAVPTLIYVVTSISKQPDGFSFSPKPISEFAPYGLMIGLMLMAFISGRGKPARTLVIFSAVNACFFAFVATGIVADAKWLIIGSGLFFSIGWSNIFSLAISGLGKMTSQGSSLLVLAIVGGAVLPPVQADLIEGAGIGASFVVPAVGMVAVAMYGLYMWRSDLVSES